MGRQPPEARILKRLRHHPGPLLFCWPANDRLDGLGINSSRIAAEVFASAKIAIPIDPRTAYALLPWGLCLIVRREALSLQVLPYGLQYPEPMLLLVTGIH